jgi:Isochorismatase family
MTTLGNRPNTALLVIDVQNGVVGGAHERDAVVANIASLVEKARRERIAVVWVQHSDEELATGSDDWRIVPELSPGDAEALVEKSYGDAFEDTTLETVLSGLGVGRLVVVGAETDACIRSTLHGAFVRGYDATLVSDAHTTGDKAAWGAPPPDQVIAHTNLYWTYTTAPGRTAGTVETKGVDFAGALSGCGETYVHAAAGDAEGRADPVARFQRVRAGQAAGNDQVTRLEREAARGELPGQPGQPGGGVTARRGARRALYHLAVDRQRDRQRGQVVQRQR